jgi:uncharacterized protein YbjT (DUF2867 family)
VTRADVASVLAAVLDEPATAGKQWNLVNGETPVGEAIREAVARQSSSPRPE